MADIFNSTPGVVAVLSESTALPGAILISSPQFPVQNSAAIITGIRYSQSTNQQFQQSLDESVYIYVFGDKMGEVIVEGLAFAATCDGSNSGIFSVADYYRANRISKSDNPIIIQAAGEIITGFLTGVEITSDTAGDDPAALTNKYRLHISALPQR